MRKRGQLMGMTAPCMAVTFVAFVGLAFDSADQHMYIGLLLAAIVMLLVAVVSLLHRLMYGEDGDGRDGGESHG